MTVKCESCGNELPKQVKFCTRCGVAVPQAQSFETNVYATEPLSADEIAVPATEALAPDTEEFPTSSASTGKVSHVTTDSLRTPTSAGSISTAPIPSNSSKKTVTITALLLLVVLIGASIYFATGQFSTTVEPVASPTPISQTTPSETQLPLNSATPDAQASPQETAEKTSDSAAEKSKTPAGSSANSTGKSEALTAADHIKLGVNAGNPSAALAEYQLALKLDPTNTDVHYLMGLAYQQLGQLNQALEAYRQCSSGKYASVAAQHVKKLEKDLKKKD